MDSRLASYIKDSRSQILKEEKEFNTQLILDSFQDLFKINNKDSVETISIHGKRCYFKNPNETIWRSYTSVVSNEDLVKDIIFRVEDGCKCFHTYDDNNKKDGIYTKEIWIYSQLNRIYNDCNEYNIYSIFIDLPILEYIKEKLKKITFPLTESERIDIPINFLKRLEFTQSFMITDVLPIEYEYIKNMENTMLE